MDLGTLLLVGVGIVVPIAALYYLERIHNRLGELLGLLRDRQP